jgi:hypothetical protein
MSKTIVLSFFLLNSLLSQKKTQFSLLPLSRKFGYHPPNPNLIKISLFYHGIIMKIAKRVPCSDEIKKQVAKLIPLPPIRSSPPF